MTYKFTDNLQNFLSNLPIERKTSFYSTTTGTDSLPPAQRKRMK
ncbi:MAG: hypothetical protein ACK42G_00205 [Candidatus Kapaibacteriota bacterium]